MSVHDWLTPDWPAPANVRACVTTRSGGVSAAPFETFNLGDHVEDDPIAVASNRQHLVDTLGCQPAWLRQVHGIVVVEANPAVVIEADGNWTATPGIACTAMTADCCNSPGRGNVGDIIEADGGANIGAAIIPRAFGKLNLEYVIAQNPQVYIATGGSHMEGTAGLLVGPALWLRWVPAALRAGGGSAGAAVADPGALSLRLAGAALVAAVGWSLGHGLWDHAVAAWCA